MLLEASRRLTKSMDWPSVWMKISSQLVTVRAAVHTELIGSCYA